MKRNIVSITSILTVAFLFVASVQTRAQQSNSLYFLEKTPFHTKWNPAMAPSRSGFGIGNSNIAFSVHSDLSYSDIYSPSPDGKELWSVFHPSADKNAFLSSLSDVSDFGASMSLDLFNLGLKFGKVYVTLSSSINSDMGIGIPKDLLKLIMLGTKNVGGDLDLSALNASAVMYQKTGMGLSMKLGNNLSVGLNANYLTGMADMRLGFDKFTVASSGSVLNITTKGDLKMTAPAGFQLKYKEDGTLNGVNIDDNYSTDLQNNPVGNRPNAGNGLSFDLGLTYKPLNFLTLSAAVLDLGSISWDPACISQAKSDDTFTYTGSDLNNGVKSDIADQLTDMMKLQKYTDVKAYSTKLTTKINLGVEAGVLDNHITFGLLSQTGIAENGNYQDFMTSVNFKPGNLLQSSLSYSLLHGEMSSFGAALNMKLLFFNMFIAADYIPLKVSPQYVPINNSYFNLQSGFNLMF